MHIPVDTWTTPSPQLPAHLHGLTMVFIPTSWWRISQADLIACHTGEDSPSDQDPEFESRSASGNTLCQVSQNAPSSELCRYPGKAESCHRSSSAVPLLLELLLILESESTSNHILAHLILNILRLTFPITHRAPNKASPSISLMHRTILEMGLLILTQHFINTFLLVHLMKPGSFTSMNLSSP